LGAGQAKRAEKTAWASAGLYAMISIVAGLFFFLFAERIIGVFNSTQDVVLIGATLIRIKSVSYIFMSFALILARSLNGAGDTFPPMVITALSISGVMIPLAWALPKVGDLGITGVWAAIVISMAVQALITMLWFSAGRWKKKEV